MKSRMINLWALNFVKMSLYMEIDQWYSVTNVRFMLLGRVIIVLIIRIPK